MGISQVQGRVNDYERVRNERIAQNKTRMEEFGIKNSVSSLRSLVNSSKRKKRKGKEKSSAADEDDSEFLPDSGNEEDDPLNMEFHEKVSQIHSRKCVQYIPPSSLKKFSNFSKHGISSQTNNISDKYRRAIQIEPLLDKEQTHMTQDVEGPNFKQNDKGKITMAEFILQKKQSESAMGNAFHQSFHLKSSTEDLTHGSKANNVSTEVRDIMEVNLITSQDKNTSMEPSIGEAESFHKNIEHEETLDDSEEQFSEEDSDQVELDVQDLEQEAILKGKTRGPTMLHDVHMRPLERRKPIILNKFGQPIGPITEEEDTVAEFSRCLGTIGRDYSCALLVYDSWLKVPNKSKMWEYVLLKYIVPIEGKDWVIKTIGAAWRIHKCRFKKKYYYQYEDDKTRWQNRSKTVPRDDFLKLLAKWNKKSEKIRCSRNRDRRLSQKNMHTAGPKSFATIREKMTNEHPNKEPPSLADMFERTRRRKEGNKYIETYDDTANKIDSMKNYVHNDDGSGPTDAYLAIMGKDYDGRCRLYGKGVCSKKLNKVDSMTTSCVVPGEIIESLKATLVEDMRKDMDSEIVRVQEMRKEMEEEHLMKKEELENMQRDLDNQRESMTEQIMLKIIERLPPSIARQYLS